MSALIAWRPLLALRGRSVRSALMPGHWRRTTPPNRSPSWSPQAPGASSDLLARTLAERLQALWGQSVVIDNRPGAGSNLGAAIAARAAPDGYTLMIGTDALMTSNVHLYKSMSFDPIKDFAPVAMAGANIIVSRRARQRARRSPCRS